MDQRLGAMPVEEESVPPNPEQLIDALRQIGYSFEQAVADLVDNCINARAKNVVVRIGHDGKNIKRLLVIDDGHGMNEGLLRKAMRFGAHEANGDLSLGKFGLGMKLASFSHAKTLSVYTVAHGSCSGRRWTVEGISRNWALESIASGDASAFMLTEPTKLDLTNGGTMIEWRRIDRLVVGKNGVDATIGRLFSRLKVHLGLHFHRFIETGRLTINLDVRSEQDNELERPIVVSPLNPFKYDATGSGDFPQGFTVAIAGIGTIRARAHIWPPNNKSPEYKLGNRAASRQGFYFYRHDRLIQAGGWNGVVEHESEPHTSLARVSIDLADSMDEHFGLNVQKSAVIVPPPFVESVLNARADDGSLFSKYRQQAERVYRKKDTRAHSDHPLIPTGSLPSQVVQRAREVLAAGQKSREVSIVWESLADPGALFEVDREEMTLRLDKRLRKKLLGGRRGTATDLPVLKLLFFFLFEQDFEKARQSAHIRKRHQVITDLLAAALRHESE